MHRFLLGYVSLKDMMTTLFGSITLPPVAALLTTITTVAGFIYDSEKAVYCLFLIMVADFISGIIKAFKLKTVSSYTMQRFPFKLFVWFSMIAILHHFGDDSFVYKYAASTLLTIFFSVELTSLVENISIISPGLIPEKVTKYLVKLNNIDDIIASLMKQQVKPGSSDAAGVVDVIAEKADQDKKPAPETSSEVALEPVKSEQ